MNVLMVPFKPNLYEKSIIACLSIEVPVIKTLNHWKTLTKEEIQCRQDVCLAGVVWSNQRRNAARREVKPPYRAVITDSDVSDFHG